MCIIKEDAKEDSQKCAFKYFRPKLCLHFGGLTSNYYLKKATCGPTLTSHVAEPPSLLSFHSFSFFRGPAKESGQQKLTSFLKYNVKWKHAGDHSVALQHDCSTLMYKTF